MRCRWLFPLVAFGAAVSAPALAHADLHVAKDPDRLETEDRKGLYLGVVVGPATILQRDRFIPASRFSYGIGGGITDRFTLGVELGASVYLGQKKAAFIGDVIAQRFIGRGLYLRGGLGVTSHVPGARDMPYRPGVGGLGGLGYEFRVAKRVALAIGVDYDARVRTDGFYSQGALLTLQLRGYFRK